jgi:hypothetical protein
MPLKSHKITFIPGKIKSSHLEPSKLPRLSSPAGGSSSNSPSFLAPAARPMMGGADLSVVAKKGRVFFYSLFYFWLSRTKVLLLFFFLWVILKFSMR